jgi:PAS domain S-box-containing protein
MEHRASSTDADLEDRDRLLDQMRAANERLVLATLEAEALAAAAEQARADAAYNEARFRALAATAATVVWGADPDGKVRVDRESWQRFTGTARDPSHPGWDWLVAVHPDDRARARTAWDRAVAERQPYLCEHRVATAAGYSSVVSRAVPIVVAGRVREWIGMMTDVTDRVRVDEAREQFIGILGHDLRNPLAAISLGAEAFSDLPEPYARVARQVLRSVKRMDVMIRDIMDFTRGRLGGGIPVAMGPCDLGLLAREVTDEIRAAHPRRDIACVVVTEDVSGTCDTARAEQVFSNLLGNAVAHGTDPIRLVVAAEADEVVISVHNGGPPIPPQVVHRLFEPFARGYRSEEPGARKGLGLGLYIVQEIVAAHGGRIAVTSSASAGTEIAIRWPRHARPRH